MLKYLSCQSLFGWCLWNRGDCCWEWYIIRGKWYIKNVLSNRTWWSVAVSSQKKSHPFNITVTSLFMESPFTWTSPKLEVKEGMRLLEEYFPDAIRRKSLHSYYTCTGSCTEVSKSEQEKQKEKATNFNIDGCLRKLWHFPKKQECGGLFMWKGRGYLASFVASTTQGASLTKIPSLTLSCRSTRRGLLYYTRKLSLETRMTWAMHKQLGISAAIFLNSI